MRGSFSDAGSVPGVAQGAKELYSDALALLDPSDSKRATILVNRAMVHKQQVCHVSRALLPPIQREPSRRTLTRRDGQNAHQDVINDTSAALDLDHANVKAYYHRAVAHEASDSLEKAISGATPCAPFPGPRAHSRRPPAQIISWASKFSRRTRRCTVD